MSIDDTHKVAKGKEHPKESRQRVYNDVRGSSQTGNTKYVMLNLSAKKQLPIGKQQAS